MKNLFSTIFAFFCLCTLVLCVCVSAVANIGQCTLYGSVLRLHVLANSDSEHDQGLKLLVRDGLIDVTEKLFCNCENVNEALEIAQENSALLQNTAKRVLENNGCDYDVNVVIGKENYPQKTYGSLVFPKGEYLSVRVLIGEGEGKNWWCVLFPPLCSAGIVEDEGKVLSSYGIDEGEIEKLRKKDGGIEIFGCRVKFKILELFE